MNIIRKSSSYAHMLLSAFVVMTLSACQGMGVHQAYEGSPRPDNEVATIIIPEAFNILFIDRTKYGVALYSGNTNISILPGKHQLIIKYKDFWDVGNQSERIESDPISITLDAVAGHRYQVRFATLANIEEARAFAKNPSIEIIDPSTHKNVAANIEYKVYTSSFFNTLFGSSNQAGENQPDKTQKSEQTSTPAATPTTTPKTTPVFAPSTTAGIAASSAQTSPSETPATGAEQKQAAEKNGRALDMLKYWWESADQAQKEAFQQWIKSQ